MFIRKSGGPIKWILFATFLGAYTTTLKLITDLQNSPTPANGSSINVNLDFKLINSQNQSELQAHDDYLLNSKPGGPAASGLTRLEHPSARSPVRHPEEGQSHRELHHSREQTMKYRHYEEMTSYLHDMSSRYPDLVSIYPIGRSVENRTLWVALITEDVLNEQVHMLRPNVKYVANMHGDETAGRELLLRLLEYLVESYHNPETGDQEEQLLRLKARELVKTTRIHLLPSMNPDGFEKAQEGECDSASAIGRTNANGFDLNRNFDDPIAHRLSGNKTQPETRAIELWIDQIPFLLSANFHGGSLVVSFLNDNGPSNPKPHEESLSPDNDVVQHLALLYSNDNPKMREGTKCNKFESFPHEITNGYQWYPVEGGMQDYNYYVDGCLEITIEVSCCKYPPASELIGLWNDNKRSLVDFLAESNRGVRGLVLNSETLEPITDTRINLAIKGREGAKFRSSQEGEFWRVLLPGNYVLMASGDGYSPIEQPFLIEPDQKHTFLQLHMKPLATGDK